MSRAALRRPDRATSADLLAQADEWAHGADAPICETGPWTLADLKHAARMAASRCRLPATSCHEDPYELAVLGVGLGISLTGNRERASRFWLYWLDSPTLPPGTAAVDARLTLARVLTALPAKHLDTLLLLAWTDSTQAAADAAGCSVHAMLIRARKARRAALALWFDGETPPDLARLLPYRTRQRVCKCGLAIDADNVRWDTSASGRRHARCKACRDKARRGAAA